jgi:hypothetical protein
MSRVLVTAAVLALAAVLTPVVAFAGGGPAGPIATFNETQIDLSKGWGATQACLVANGGVECFADRAGLLAREQQLSASQSVCGNATDETQHLERPMSASRATTDYPDSVDHYL